MKKIILPILIALLTLNACQKSNSVELQIVNSSDYYVVVSIDGDIVARLNSLSTKTVSLVNTTHLEYYIYIERYSSSSCKELVSTAYVYKQLLSGYTYKLFINNDGGRIEGALK